MSALANQPLEQANSMRMFTDLAPMEESNAPKIHLYLLKREDEVDYDEYSEIVVAAANAEIAKGIGPHGWNSKNGHWQDCECKRIQLQCVYLPRDFPSYHTHTSFCFEKAGPCSTRPSDRILADQASWAPNRELLTVREIGVAAPDIREGQVLCASFHAG